MLIKEQCFILHNFMEHNCSRRRDSDTSDQESKLCYRTRKQLP